MKNKKVGTKLEACGVEVCCGGTEPWMAAVGLAGEVHAGRGEQRGKVTQAMPRSPSRGKMGRRGSAMEAALVGGGRRQESRFGGGGGAHC